MEESRAVNSANAAINDGNRVLALLFGLVLFVLGGFFALYIYTCASIVSPKLQGAERTMAILRRIFVGRECVFSVSCILVTLVGCFSVLLAVFRRQIPTWWMWLILAAFILPVMLVFV